MISISPIKKQPLTNYLIHNEGNQYTMFSKKDGKLLGRMIVKERFHGKLSEEDFEYYPKKENYTSLYIVALIAKVKRHGVGRAFIELAKKLANNERCQNRVTVYAMNNQEGSILDAPSPFYRKCGFTSVEKPGLDDVDRVIKGQKPKNGDWYCSLPMYLPIKKSH